MQDSNTQKHGLGGDNADNKKSTQRRKRKSNVEKSLEVVMQSSKNLQMKTLRGELMCFFVV